MPTADNTPLYTLLKRNNYIEPILDLISPYSKNFYVVGGAVRDAHLSRSNDIPYKPADLDIVIPVSGLLPPEETPKILHQVKNLFKYYKCKTNEYFPNGIKLEKKGDIPIDIWVDSGTITEILSKFTLNIQHIGMVVGTGQPPPSGESYSVTPLWGKHDIHIVNPSGRPDHLTATKILKLGFKYNLPFSQETLKWLADRKELINSSYLSAWRSIENDRKT